MRMIKSGLKKYPIGDMTGAFADGAVLFPLLAALALQTGMNGAVLLATAGAAYIAAGLVFRVPMSVQPLKSVVVAALAMGASAAEVGWSGFAVGIACLALSFCGANRLSALVPRRLVHGLQLALGIMLMAKGVQGGISGPDIMTVVFICMAGATIALSLWTDRPIMGWIATAGLLAGIYGAVTGHDAPARTVANPVIHINVILALTLPQLALTLVNSVIGTHDVAQRYFGDAASRVTPARLLRSIGIGNILVAPLGGLPFCHGAGGVTAHVKGGARSWRMNLVIGGTLLSLALASQLLSVPVIPAYPKLLMSALLVATGWFHLGLAAASWKNAGFRLALVIMGVTALLTQDMLMVLAAGIVCEALRRLVVQRRERMAE
ncbi:MAG: hypothetical protein EPN97_13110 [Alphaproteobacteria bacterium]|nr:MAG: hypothetical protein EPN97_13110 [Alphaproteobacteria bacterium]